MPVFSSPLGRMTRPNNGRNHKIIGDYGTHSSSDKKMAFGLASPAEICYVIGSLNKVQLVCGTPTCLWKSEKLQRAFLDLRS
mmetsp:Transcript_54843/g.74977  ORF Transcript_54843/g.74977 Transcript_54843/m.74977 type:complete len:82 (+) Transcript_54843:1579-1824(+)